MPLLSTPSRAKRFFDRLAPAYDRINTRIYREAWRSRIRGEILGPRVLDVGVGTGFTTGHLETAVGIDLSLEMLHRARHRGQLVRADFLLAPFRDTTFDTVLFAGSFYYLGDPLAGMREAARLLRPGGRILLLSPATILLAPMVRVYSPEQYEAMMARAGIRMERYDRLNWAACFVRGSKT